MMIRFVVVVFVVFCLINESYSCGFGSLGGGGGGSCGGGCGGGCGRKKREISVIEPHVRTEQILMCPQLDWQSVIQENMSKDVESSKFSIQGALYKKYETKFYVSCHPENAGYQFASNGEGYCTFTRSNMTCTAIALIG